MRNYQSVDDGFFEQTGKRPNKRGKKLEQKAKARAERNKTTTVALDNLDVKDIKPITRSQSKAFTLFQKENKNLALLGCAGTGKTFLASYLALQKLMDKSAGINKIIIVRSAVQSRDMGFTPGSVGEKEEPYKQIYRNIFGEVMGGGDAFALLEKKGYIEFMSTSFLRGLTFNDAIIIFDEIQNCNFTEISTVISRLGQNSRIILAGDFRQTDLIKKNDQSGFQDFVKIAGKMQEFGIVDFQPEDIVRSGFVRAWFEALAKS
ncbi:PhoH-like protein [Ochrobactrum phage vB_OspM_OC]|nr:PhoH-like protein [Ochrobactrum phage vB_OspM_OC]